MLTDDTYLLYTLLVSNALLLGAASIAVLRLQNLVKNTESFWKSPTGAALREADPNNATLDERLSSLQRDVDEISGKDGATLQQTTGLPFETAVRMAKHGASIDDLTRSCGLRKVEAQLMMRVHAGKGTTASSVKH